MYTDILCCLRDAVRSKHQEKWETNSWFLLHYNAPAHWSVLVKEFLAKNNVKTLAHPPYSPDLAPADFYVPSSEISNEGMLLLWC
jgi:histone-lysine N-methyltransferase SETMAR